MQTEADRRLRPQQGAATRSAPPYGNDPQGRQLLIARRLVERGVRFVQVWHGTASPGTTTRTSRSASPQAGPGDATSRSPRCSADLKQRGLLDDTLVIWGGEFGRTPTVETRNGTSNAAATTTTAASPSWLAGGGVKGGYVHGATDEFGCRGRRRTRSTSTTCTRRSCTCSASTTTKLTYRYAGRDFRLTDVAGNVVKELIA